MVLESLECRRVFAAAVINEISVNPSGTDQPYEYVEIKGIPGATIENLYFVSIEGDSPVFGTADLVYDLSGQVFGSNGMLAIVADAVGHNWPAETTLMLTEDFNVGTGQTLENGTNTFALISSPTPIVQGTDLSPTGTDQNILTLENGAFVVDAFGWSDGGATDIVYGSANLTSNSALIGAATRFPHDNRGNTTGAWYFGAMSAPNSSTLYTTNTANRSVNFPDGGALTPGAYNAPGSNTAPIGNSDVYDVAPSATIDVSAGSGVVSNDVDPDGANSILFAELLSSPSIASTFVFNEDGSFSYTAGAATGTDSFTYRATDLNLFSEVVSVTINIALNNNLPPELTIPVESISYTENGVPAIVTTLGSIVDPDSPNFGSGSLVVDLTENAQPEDRLEIRSIGTGPGEISVAGNTVSYEGVAIGTWSGGLAATPLTVELNGNASIVATQALLRSVTFRTETEAPNTSIRTIRFVLNDGDAGPSGGLSNTVTQQVSVVAVNDDPVMATSRSSLTYVAGGNPVTLDGLTVVSDVDSNFGGGNLTAVISGQSQPGDQLSVRSTGTAADQVSVIGGEVAYGGTVIGTFSGGSSGVPLTISFQASATAAGVQAVVRALTFQTSEVRLMPAVRTISIDVTDGDGGASSMSFFSVSQSQVRRYGFQENVDSGQGYYTGAGDVMLFEPRPDDNVPAANNPTEGLLVDFDGGTANSAVLLKFEDIFGTNPGQIPLGSHILNAKLVLDTNNPGDGGSFHRMLIDWDADAATWNSIPATVEKTRNDGITARVDFDSQVGTSAGTGDTAAGVTTIGVTADIQAWSNGETNLGWLMQGWNTRTDGWGFTASEDPVLADRPKLLIEWLPASFATSDFQQGVNDYTGTVDTFLTAATPDADNSASSAMSFVDFNDQVPPNTANTGQFLLQFNNIQGGLTGQIPNGALVHFAGITLAGTGGNATGDGGTFHAMLQGLASPLTWNGFVDGVSADGVEASTVVSASAGNSSRAPNVEAGWNTFEVTQDVQAWVAGSLSNNGWAVLPWLNGTDGWGIHPSESVDQKLRPILNVAYTPVGIDLSTPTATQTTESGGSVSFQVVLATPPSSDVTIGVSSNDASEGVTDKTSLLFTPDNWDVPQTVVVTGANDSLDDGDVAYAIVFAPANSADVNYNGQLLPEIALTNIDDDNGAVAPKVGTAVLDDGTEQRSSIRSLTVTFDAEVEIDANVPGDETQNAFRIRRLEDGLIVIANYVTALIEGKTVATISFEGDSITGGSLADGNYQLTIQSSKVRVGGQALDGDQDGTAGGDYVLGASQADQFYRLFGDSDGNRIVGTADFNRLRNSFGKGLGDPLYNDDFDVDNNGLIGTSDFNSFRSRFGKTI